MFYGSVASEKTILTAKRRIIMTAVAMSVFLAFLIYNLFSLQILNYSLYKEKVYEQITTSSALKAKRGAIYDRNMNLLATDKTVYRIFVSSKEIKKASKRDKTNYTEIIARRLSEALALNSTDIQSKIESTNKLDVTVKKNASEEEYQSVLTAIKEDSLENMIFTEAQTTRYYPGGTLAAHTLGFVGSDLQGLYGLEYSYNSTLSGKDGYYLYAKDANGNSIPTEYASYVEPTDGYSIVTTLDTFVQGELEEQLEKIRLMHGAQNRVTGIVMDTQTGAILAMATTTPFDPNSPYELDVLSQDKLDKSGFAEGSDEYKAYKKELLEIMWSNKAISETYEPGSTFKIITVAAALDAGVASVDDTFSCHGYLSVGGYNIRCHKKGGHGSGFDLAYGLQMSCNPTMMTIAERLGAKEFYKYVEAFGYFEKTGIDLPSEASTIFHKEENIGTTELATASFGQRFKVSIIRQLTSVAAIANGGRLVTPHLVESIIDENGLIIEEKSYKSGNSAVSQTIANTVADILEKGVSGDGGAKNAAVEGYKIAAKTGTSEKFDVLDENGNSYLRIGSTVAFSLSDDGGVAVIIVVDEPTSQVKYGSVVAAPYVSSLLEATLPYIGYKSESEEKHLSIGSLVGLDIDKATGILKENGIAYRIIGEGKTVISQTPNPLDPFLTSVGTVILYTEDSPPQYSIVPNLIGLSADSANELLIQSGLNMRITGTIESGVATVVSQSIPSGSVVPLGTVVELYILYLDFED